MAQVFLHDETVEGQNQNALAAATAAVPPQTENGCDKDGRVVKEASEFEVTDQLHLSQRVPRTLDLAAFFLFFPKENIGAIGWCAILILTFLLEESDPVDPF